MISSSRARDGGACIDIISARLYCAMAYPAWLRGARVVERLAAVDWRAEAIGVDLQPVQRHEVVLERCCLEVAPCRFIVEGEPVLAEQPRMAEGGVRLGDRRRRPRTQAGQRAPRDIACARCSST